MQITSVEGDTVDGLCHRHLGVTAGVVEQAYSLNPGLAAIGPVLPLGTPVTLPDAAPKVGTAPTIQLWD